MQNIFIGVCMIIMVIVIFGQVVNRFILHFTIPWFEELGRYVMIYMVFIGSTVVAREGLHIKVTMVEEKFKGKAAKALKIFQNLVIFAFLVLILILSYRLLSTQMRLGRLSPALQISMWMVYLAIPLWSVTTMIDMIYSLVLIVKARGTAINENKGGGDKG